MTGSGLFASFFMAGFECSAQRRHDGRRLDLLAATGHDRLAEQDYRQVAAHGLRTVRDGLRWHRIERIPGHYDWSSFLPMLRAARLAGVQPIWDLCHYGAPDGLDIWGGAFVERLARFAAAAARLIREETGTAPILCPINEISFWAWACDHGKFYPCARGRGDELKRQLVRAAIAAMDAAREAVPEVRFIHAEPLIHVAALPQRPQDAEAAAAYVEVQYVALDMLAGRLLPELGGGPAYLDIVGCNYYCDNQWFYEAGTIPMGHHLYRPLHELLAQTFARYGRPLLLTETGAEGSGRASWLHYVVAEARAAMAAGVPVEGICLYPVCDYPGWENERLCAVGLLGAPDASGHRPVHAPLAEELRRQQETVAAGRPRPAPLLERAG